MTTTAWSCRPSCETSYQDCQCYKDGVAAWHSDKALEEFEAERDVNDAFIEGWMDAKHSDPEWIEENMIWGDDEPTSSTAPQMAD